MPEDECSSVQETAEACALTDRTVDELAAADQIAEDLAAQDAADLQELKAAQGDASMDPVLHGPR